MIPDQYIQWMMEWMGAVAKAGLENDGGIRIVTLDNPGWLVDIDSFGAQDKATPENTFQELRTETDWIACRVEDEVVKIRCGVFNLPEALDLARRLCPPPEPDPEYEAGGTPDLSDD